MQSVIQILKLNEPRPWTMDGRSGVSHSAECMLLAPDGSVDSVGVLRIRGEEMIAKAKVGMYMASFGLRANPGSRVIEAVLTDLRPVQRSGGGFVPVPPPAPAPAPAQSK